MKAGIAPELLVSQVRNTAAWLWLDPRARSASEALDDAGAIDAYKAGAGAAYFALLLAAHFATVATFVPTDVDARIRHHVWMERESGVAVAALSDVVDRVASWDVHAVSARVVHDGRLGPLSGHDGEWLAVRAGALGRASVLGAADIVDRLVTAIDSEVDREERIFREAIEANAPARRVLSVATIVAHNLGDLSRVVVDWPREVPASLRARWSRLGHHDAGRTARRLLVRAGALNKALLAHENHRFLSLRKPRALRASRELLLPIGPWFDSWGETVARSTSLEDTDRAEVLAALLELHARDPSQEGCLRAIAGIHRALRGGVEVLIPHLPARLRKSAVRGKVREALAVSEEHFAARMERRYRALLDR